MKAVSREGFADEGSWLQFNANLAEMQRRERLRRNIPKFKQAKPSERVRKALSRPGWRRKAALWAASHPEQRKAMCRASHARNRTHRLAGMRAYNQRTHDQRVLYDQMYYQDNRASILARKAAERAARKARQEAVAKGELIYVALGGLKPSTVFRLKATGECGAVVMYQRSKGTVLVNMESRSNVRAAPDTQVEIVAEPWELASAYVQNTAIRTLTDGTLATMRREPARVMERLLGKR